MKKFKFIFIGALISLLITEPVSAAIKVGAKNADFTINYASPGDQVNSGLLTGNSLIISSTIENPTTTIASALLTSYGLDGSKQWELPISGESIAGPVTRDASGNIYLLGATMTPQTELPLAPQQATINPDNVQIDPVTKPTNTLSSIAVWKISNTGTLMQVFTAPINEAVNPLSISNNSTGILIGATTAKKYFQMTMDSNGVFSTPSYLKAPKMADLAQDIKYGKEKLKFLPAAKSLIGIPTWRPKKGMPVLIQYTKLGAKRAVNSFSGTPLFVFYKLGVGVVVGCDTPTGFGINVVKPLI